MPQAQRVRKTLRKVQAKLNARRVAHAAMVASNKAGAAAFRAPGSMNPRKH